MGLYTLQELRAIGLGTPASNDVLSESALQQMIMNEAYYGRKQVAKIQKAMDDICRVHLDNPNKKINDSTEGKALETAIKDAFGFKRCTVYWTNGPDLSFGPFTMPAAHIFTDDGSYVKIGDNTNGFYDTNHRISIAISSDLCLFREPYNMTSEEMVAIFLHEIGHNFDYTGWGIMKAWFNVLDLIISTIQYLIIGDMSSAAGMVIAGGVRMIFKNYPEIGVRCFNINDIILNIIPPIGTVVRGVGAALNPIKKLLKTILTQMKWAQIPYAIMSLPFNMIGNTLLRKSETFADSFSAAYGYGPEQVKALQKLDLGTSTTSMNLGPVTEVFNDLALMQVEVIQACRMGHGSTQQRAIRMADALDESLKKSGLSAADKKAILDEKKRIMDVYQKFVDLPDEQGKFLTRTFNRMVDDWYDGKPYIIIPNSDKNYAD